MQVVQPVIYVPTQVVSSGVVYQNSYPNTSPNTYPNSYQNIVVRPNQSNPSAPLPNTYLTNTPTPSYYPNFNSNTNSNVNSNLNTVTYPNFNSNTNSNVNSNLNTVTYPKIENVNKSNDNQQKNITQQNSIWHSGLFDCFSDISICCKGLLCPCVLYGQNVKRLEGSDCCCNCIGYLLCCPPCLETSFRRRLRNKYNLPVDPCSDCCVGWFCTPCGLCQEARELDHQLSQPGEQIMK